MTDENISQEFRLKNLNETRIYFLEEIKENELMGKKNNKVCATLNYIKHFLILASTVTGCITISTLISKALINLVISHYEFVLIKNIQKKYNDVKEKNENSHNK